MTGGGAGATRACESGTVAEWHSGRDKGHAFPGPRTARPRFHFTMLPLFASPLPLLLSSPLLFFSLLFAPSRLRANHPLNTIAGSSRITLTSEIVADSMQMNVIAPPVTASVCHSRRKLSSVRPASRPKHDASPTPSP